MSTLARDVVDTSIWPMSAMALLAPELSMYAPAGPPTTALHDPVRHASPSRTRTAELPNAHRTPPGHLTSGARGNPRTHPRRMGRGTAPGRHHPADALRTRCGWSCLQMISAFSKPCPYARPFDARSLVPSTRPPRDLARKKHWTYVEKPFGYQGAWVI